MFSYHYCCNDNNTTNAKICQNTLYCFDIATNLCNINFSPYQSSLRSLLIFLFLTFVLIFSYPCIVSYFYRAHVSTYHALGKGTMLFMQALLTMESVSLSVFISNQNGQNKLFYFSIQYLESFLKVSI